MGYISTYGRPLTLFLREVELESEVSHMLPPLSIHTYPCIHLSEQGHRGENEIVQTFERQQRH